MANLELQFAESSAAGDPAFNEDFVGFWRETEDVAWAWVIDGATSIETSFLIEGQQAGRWLARGLHRLFHGKGDHETPQTRLVRALEAVTHEFLNLTSSEPWPLWARPIAALSLLRFSAGKTVIEVESANLGDCAILRAGARVQWVYRKKSTLDDRISPAAPQSRLNALSDIKERRNRIYSRAEIDLAVCHPDISKIPAIRNTQLKQGDSLIAMTDGLLRYIYEYRLGTASELVSSMSSRCGFLGVIEKLRSYEILYQNRSDRLIKHSDDASAVSVAFCY